MFSPDSGNNASLHFTTEQIWHFVMLLVRAKEKEEQSSREGARAGVTKPHYSGTRDSLNNASFQLKVPMRQGELENAISSSHRADVDSQTHLQSN